MLTLYINQLLPILPSFLTYTKEVTVSVCLFVLFVPAYRLDKIGGDRSETGEMTPDALFAFCTWDNGASSDLGPWWHQGPGTRFGGHRPREVGCSLRPMPQIRGRVGTLPTPP